MPTRLDKVLYTAHTHTTGGRDGHAKSDDGRLDIKLSPPASMDGKGDGTNPEQLFAAGYSACFMGALKHVAQQKQIKVPDEASIDTDVQLGPIQNGFGIAVKMVVSLPGLDRTTAQNLVDAAHVVCPYSNATRNNIDVNLSLA